MVDVSDFVSKHSYPRQTTEALERLARQMATRRKVDGVKKHVARSSRARLGRDGVAELVRAYGAGEASTSLAKRMGVSKQSVVKILREEGVAIRCQPITEAQCCEAVRRYESGESIRQVATQLDCDFETVRQVLLKRGVGIRPATGR